MNRTGTIDPHTSSPLRMLIGGILGMMVAMGIGRFAFTPILPLMQRDLGVSHSLAGGLAAANYAGYLAGALLCAIWPQLLRRRVVNVGAIFVCIVSTAGMGFTADPVLWGGLRTLGGLASAFLFVAIAIEVAEKLQRTHHVRWGSALYGGIGLGIALSGAVVPLLDRSGGWRSAWIGMGILSILLAGAGVLIAGKRQSTVPVCDIPPVGSARLQGLGRLAFVYFLEGVGYIVSATFLVTMIAHTPGLSPYAPWSWVAVGLAAAPSTIIWQQLAHRIGVRAALTTAYLLQSCGILLSSVASQPWSAGLAAVIFGGTFLGIVALAMAEGGRRAGREGRRAAAVMTVCFGGGQVIGPLIGGLLADRHGDFTLSLILAAAVVAGGGILIATDRGFNSSPSSKE